MITYELKPVHEVLDYLQSMEDRHYDDIKDKSMYPEICMNWEMYEDLSREGLCYAILAVEDGEYIGYSCYTLTTDLNKNNEILAVNVALYIEKKYRGRLVVDFIEECDNILKGIEVKQVLQSYSDIRIGKLLEKAGYEPKSITWRKTL